MAELIIDSGESLNPSPTPTVEDYLWMIYTLLRDGEEVIGARLSELLGVSPPTVTVTLKRMVRDGWVILKQNKHIQLTLEGMEAAKTVLRRHMLVEWLLAEMLNVPWSRLHDEAHELEHYISDDVEARLAQQLGHPKVCPHGNPIPGNEEFISAWINLLDAPLNRDVILRRVHEHAENRTKLMHFFEQNNVLPGIKIKVVNILPFNQTVSIEIEGSELTLGFSTAQYLYVQLAL